MRPINLLPPEVSEQRAKRRRVFGLLVLAALYLVLLGAGVFYWNGKVSSARDDVAAQQQINDGLRNQVASLAEAENIKTEFEDRADLVRIALADDVDWGVLLNDLARLLPANVWLQEFTGTTATNQAGVLGLVSFSGVGFDYPDVSAWIRALDGEDFVGITGTWVSTAAEGSIGDTPIVSFSSSAVLTEAAATNRADDLIPEVP